MKNQILISSDHHANWEALEELFRIAKEKEIPFVINGDIIGDYNFEEIAEKLNLKFPYEITTKELENNLEKEELEYLSTFEQLQQTGGNIEPFLQQIPKEHHETAKKQFKQIIEFIQSEKFQKKYEQINDKIIKENNHIISLNKIKLKSLYKVIIKEHAKILANLIQTYQVKTYFVLGNHEPVYFSDLVEEELQIKNKIFNNNCRYKNESKAEVSRNLFINLNKTKGITNANNLNIVAVSNVKALMPFLHKIYKVEELNYLFPHQMGSEREILFNNVNQNSLKENNQKIEKDFDYIRIINHETFNKNNIDIFFSHGQIGRGSWNSNKHANEMPTLRIAAYLSNLAKLTIDGHLHTTHEMTNSLGKKTIRAVGNKAYLLTKENNQIKKELIETDKEYNHKNGLEFDNFEELNNKIIKEIFIKN